MASVPILAYLCCVGGAGVSQQWRLTNIILVLPLQSDRQIVVLVNKVQEPLQEVVALCLCHSVDMLNMVADRVNTLPPGNWVCSNDRMDCPQFRADVFWRTTWLVVQLEPSLLGQQAKEILLIGNGQALEELLVGLADTVIDFIARGPQRV